MYSFVVHYCVPNKFWVLMNKKCYFSHTLHTSYTLFTHTHTLLMHSPRTHFPHPTQVLRSKGLTLTGILETHFHADFVSGHYELMQRTGAPIYFGPTAKARTQFDIHEVRDGEVCGVCLCVCVWSGRCVVWMSCLYRVYIVCNF